MPPCFHALGEPFSGHGRGCAVELAGGGDPLHGELVSFEPELGSLAIRVAGQDAPRTLALDEVRALKLTSPFVLVRNGPAARALADAGPPIPNDVPFVVTLDDGSQITGRTRGAVRRPFGVFLFLVDGESRETVACFLPSQRVRRLQLTSPAGAIPMLDDAASHQALNKAHDSPPALREKRQNAYLSGRAIASPEVLGGILRGRDDMPTMRLGDLLVQRGLITREELGEALRIKEREPKRRLGQILVDMGVVTARAIQVALSERLGIPYVNVREFPVERAALRLLPRVIAQSEQVLPLMRTDEGLVIATEDPVTSAPARHLSAITGLDVLPAIADPADLRARIALEYARLDDAGTGRGSTPSATDAAIGQQAIDNLALELSQDAPTSEPGDEEDARVTDNALVRLVNKMIMDAHVQGASDIHIENNHGQASTRIRFRKDGDLENYLELPPPYRSALVSRIKIMADLDIAEHRHAQDGKINFGRFAGVPIELRVAVVPTANGLEDVVLRLLGGVEPLPIDRLGLCARDLGELKRMVGFSYGLILVCGPTGSGKTTTLHSILHHINRPDLKIWTAEDPIEITQSGLRQVQINSKIGWTFANAMRAFLRADPDVIMVGEMRDAETTKIGIEASLTGHLVMSTLHTNSAAESVVRLLELGMDSFNFADALIGILSQRLARRLCPKCKKSHEATETELASLASEYCAGTDLDPGTVIQAWRKEYGRNGAILLHEPVGCDHCSQGWRGRMGVYELLVATPEVKQLIRSRGTVPQLVQAGFTGGMRLLRQDAISKVLDGSLDLVTARAAST